MNWIDFLISRLADGRVPILTVLARIYTDADRKDARIWVRLLTDEQLLDEMVSEQIGGGNRAIRREVLDEVTRRFTVRPRTPTSEPTPQTKPGSRT